MLEIVDREAAPVAQRLFDAITADSLLASLLVLHGLHPLSLETRVRQALDSVRPYLGSHGGDVTVTGIDDGVVRLRLEGSCHGCPSSQVTMKLAVERAIEEAAPEVVRIEVEGIEEAPPTRDPAPVQIGGHGRRGNGQAAPGGGPSWIPLGAPPQPGPGGLASVELPGINAVVCKGDEASVLAGGALDREILACPACSRRYDVRRAGGCLDGQDLHLEPLPLLSEQGALKIAVPSA
jgi:Fe-S cluster biogenesis protein NfuA